MLKYRVAFARIAIALALSACAPLDDDAFEQPSEDVDSEVEGNEQAIYNGIVVTGKRGVVELIGTMVCTGAMIGPRTIITSAHCIPEWVGATRKGPITRNIFYHHPTSGRRQLTNTGLTGIVKESYVNNGRDTMSDIGIITTTSTWSGTTSSDYLSLSLGSCAQIDRTELFGAGTFDYSGALEDDLLRKMPVNVHWCGQHHFFDLSGTRTVCKSDSGGPYILNAGGIDLVTGLLSNADLSSGGRCARLDGTEQRAVRINTDKVGWIESKIGGCTRFTASGVPAARCF